MLRIERVGSFKLGVWRLAFGVQSLESSVQSQFSLQLTNLNN